MCSIVSSHSRPQHRPDPDRRPAQARVPRLRLGRPRCSTTAACIACAQLGGCPSWPTAPMGWPAAPELPTPVGRPTACPSERNAHPHVSGGLAVVHNGIIENFGEIKAQLARPGAIAFDSETDTEVIAHLIEHKLRSHADLVAAVRAACVELIGAYAIAVLSEKEPHRVVVARHGAPLLLGLGEDGHYAASDTAALLPGDAHDDLSRGWRHRRDHPRRRAHRRRRRRSRRGARATKAPSRPTLSSWGVTGTTCRRRSSSSRRRWPIRSR
ncbi:MAG: hypothetical protein M5R42_00280 [Rhodocyclaceae bacterium]|nr:hypothetical protein [Rhodocyclaceae bacterium]